MNKIYKMAMICLLNCVGVNICAQYYFPTLSQWQSFESVASQLPEGFYKKIAQKKEIKQNMIANPTLTSVKAGIIAAISGYGSLFNSPEEKKVMAEKDAADGWGRDPRLNPADADSLFIKIIESGDTVALESFLEMTKETSFDINKKFAYGITSNGKSFQYYNEYQQYTPLMLAVTYKQSGITEMLIRHGANVSQQIINQALSLRNKELAEMLIFRAVRLGQANIAIGEISVGGAPVDGVVVAPSVRAMNDEYVDPSGLNQFSQKRQQNQGAVLATRRAIQDRSSSGWYMIFLMLLFLPNLCLSYMKKEQIKEVIHCFVR